MQIFVQLVFFFNLHFQHGLMHNIYMVAGDKPILEPEDASCWQFSVVLRVWCSDGDIIFWVR